MLFAYKDYGGSFYAWVDAINKHTDWAARLVTILPHQFGYPNDLIYGASLLIPDEAYDLFSQANVIHIKDEIGFFEGRNKLPKDFFTRYGRPMVFTQYGGFARAMRNDLSYRDYVNGHDAVVCITPDLCFDWLNEPRYVPHAIDTKAVPRSWTDSLRVGHSPSTQSRKGTGNFVEAMNKVADLKLELDLIEGVSHDECIERKARLSLFFDQAGVESIARETTDRIIGWYGNSALESAVRGIPTIAHLSQEAFAGASRGGHDIDNKCVIINTALGAEALEQKIRWYFDLSHEQRLDLSLQTRKWVEDFHDHSIVGPQLASVYSSISTAAVE